MKFIQFLIGVSTFLFSGVSLASCPSSSTYQAEMLSYVNAFRAQGGICGSTKYASVGKLVLHSQLNSSSLGHAKDMAARNYFSHTSLNGRTPTDRIKSTGYLVGAKSWSTGENIGAGTIRNNAQTQFLAWKKSPGHCANMMSGKFQHLGISCAYTSTSQYKHYWVMNLGRNGK